ncbi:hypothetical protein AMTR_s00076p00090210 [Amborella trichopoda]|uniref:Uncharacterized protein n=1 Tax=Amborella trichopoda TaxID=13333 RepID=W1PAH7_AMBTC|nr:hypothetical protein AMTR_s00076p00090210 [Amborella trichopoda]
MVPTIEDLMRILVVRSDGEAFLSIPSVEGVSHHEAIRDLLGVMPPIENTLKRRDKLHLSWLEDVFMGEENEDEEARAARARRQVAIWTRRQHEHELLVVEPALSTTLVDMEVVHSLISVGGLWIYGRPILTTPTLSSPYSLTRYLSGAKWGQRDVPSYDLSGGCYDAPGDVW